MARFNKIYLGPVTEATPQVQEAPASAAITPGTLVVITAGEFANAGAATVGKVWIAQDNYLAMKGVDTDWDSGDTMIGMELLPHMIYAGLIANGVTVAPGTALTPAAGGLLAVASSSDKVIGYAEEAYTNGTGSEQLIKFRASQGYLTAAA